MTIRVNGLCYWISDIASLEHSLIETHTPATPDKRAYCSKHLLQVLNFVKSLDLTKGPDKTVVACWNLPSIKFVKHNFIELEAKRTNICKIINGTWSVGTPGTWALGWLFCFNIQLVWHGLSRIPPTYVCETPTRPRSSHAEVTLSSERREI